MRIGIVGTVGIVHIWNRIFNGVGNNEDYYLIGGWVVSGRREAGGEWEGARPCAGVGELESFD